MSVASHPPFGLARSHLKDILVSYILLHHKANILDQYHLVKTAVLRAIVAVGYSVGWMWMRFLTLF